MLTTIVRSARLSSVGHLFHSINASDNSTSSKSSCIFAQDQLSQIRQERRIHAARSNSTMLLANSGRIGKIHETARTKIIIDFDFFFDLG